jgi:type IV pilus assembly protein PilV
MNPRSPLRYAKRRQNSGFTLVEVLVSIVVLSFGLLGMVGLQAASLQANRDARLQSNAIVLARELAEMMRGNKDVALLTAANPYLGAFSSPLVPASPQYCLNVGSTCASKEDVASAELTEWLARVDAELPSAEVKICHDATPFDGSGLPGWACTDAVTDPIVVKIGWTRNTKRTGNAALDVAELPSVILSVTAGSKE